MTTIRARIAAALATALIFTACGEHAANVTAPDDASYNGGYTFGGGNRSDTTTTTASSGGGAVVNSGGGYTFGGGN